jgi:hypothetical protein
VSIILPALAVAFAALCAWLGVRTYNQRERWAKWTLAIFVGVPVLYVVSFGPACWVYSRMASDDETWVTLDFIYAPFLRVWRYHDGTIPEAIEWYANVCSAVEVQAAKDMNASDSDPVFLVRIGLGD